MANLVILMSNPGLSHTDVNCTSVDAREAPCLGGTGYETMRLSDLAESTFNANSKAKGHVASKPNLRHGPY